MKAYVFQAALLCEDCAHSAMLQQAAWCDNEDSNYYPQGPHGKGGGEADSPQHCDHCQTFLENPLTSDGEAYVREAVASGNGVNIEEWREYYSYLFN
jgi:hypothetical protein